MAPVLLEHFRAGHLDISILIISDHPDKVSRFVGLGLTQLLHSCWMLLAGIGFWTLPLLAAGA